MVHLRQVVQLGRVVDFRGLRCGGGVGGVRMVLGGSRVGIGMAKGEGGKVWNGG